MESSSFKPSNSPRLNPRAENERLQSKNMFLVEQIVELEKAISQKEKQVKQEKDKLSKSVNDLQQMKESMAQNSDKVTSLTRRNEELTNNLQSNRMTIEDLSEALAGKHAEVQILHTKLAELYKLLDFKEIVISNLMVQNQHAEAINFQQKLELAQKCQENAEILHDLNGLLARLVALTQDFASVNEKLEDAKVKIRKLRNQLIAANVAVELKDSALFVANAELQAQEYALDRVREESNQQKLQLEMNKETINQLKMVRDEAMAYAYEVYNQMCDLCEDRATVDGLRKQMREIELSKNKQLAAYEQRVQEKEKKIESLEKELSFVNSFYEEDTKRQFNRVQKNGSLHNSVSASEAGDGEYGDKLTNSASDCGGDSVTPHPRGDNNSQEASAGISSDQGGACAIIKSEAQEDLHDSKLESSTSSFFRDGKKIALAEDIKSDISGNDNQPCGVDKDKAHEQRGKYSRGSSKKDKQKDSRTSWVKKEEE